MSNRESILTRTDCLCRSTIRRRNRTTSATTNLATNTMCQSAVFCAPSSFNGKMDLDVSPSPSPIPSAKTPAPPSELATTTMSSTISDPSMTGSSAGSTKVATPMDSFSDCSQRSDLLFHLRDINAKFWTPIRVNDRFTGGTKLLFLSCVFRAYAEFDVPEGSRISPTTTKWGSLPFTDFTTTVNESEYLRGESPRMADVSFVARKIVDHHEETFYCRYFLSDEGAQQVKAVAHCLVHSMVGPNSRLSQISPNELPHIPTVSVFQDQYSNPRQYCQHHAGLRVHRSCEVCQAKTISGVEKGSKKEVVIAISMTSNWIATLNTNSEVGVAKYSLNDVTIAPLAAEGPSATAGTMKLMVSRINVSYVTAAMHAMKVRITDQEESRIQKFAAVQPTPFDDQEITESMMSRSSSSLSCPPTPPRLIRGRNIPPNDAASTIPSTSPTSDGAASPTFTSEALLARKQPTIVVPGLEPPKDMPSPPPSTSPSPHHRHTHLPSDAIPFDCEECEFAMFRVSDPVTGAWMVLAVSSSSGIVAEFALHKRGRIGPLSEQWNFLESSHIQFSPPNSAYSDSDTDDCEWTHTSIKFPRLAGTDVHELTENFLVRERDVCTIRKMLAEVSSHTQARIGEVDADTKSVNDVAEKNANMTPQNPTFAASTTDPTPAPEFETSIPCSSLPCSSTGPIVFPSPTPNTASSATAAPFLLPARALDTSENVFQRISTLLALPNTYLPSLLPLEQGQRRGRRPTTRHEYCMMLQKQFGSVEERVDLRREVGHESVARLQGAPP
ncbi:hypothetical protein HDU93_000877 [Gonapodya sp. JEL0774]|nr:hypothetical protein HDU93_000877 [Gonapodya sp. JEL0774]